MEEKASIEVKQCEQIFVFKENKYAFRTAPNGIVIDDIRQLLVLPPQRSCTLAILAIPSEITPERFCEENLPEAEFGRQIAHRFVMR